MTKTVRRILLEVAKNQLKAERERPYDDSWMKNRPTSGATAQEINAARQKFWQDKIDDLT